MPAEAPRIPEAKLWELSISEAMNVRWLQGRARHGRKWAGRHPLVEMHEELIDALVYARVASPASMGALQFSVFLPMLREMASWVAERLVELEELPDGLLPPDSIGDR